MVVARVVPLAATLVFVCSMGVIAVYDIKYRRIPDVLVLGTLVILAALEIPEGFRGVLLFFLWSGIGFLIVLAVRLFSGGRMGMGDVKLSGLIAGALGPVGWLITLFVASAGGILWALTGIARGKMKRDDAIPFAPLLAVGSACFIVISIVFELPEWNVL